MPEPKFSFVLSSANGEGASAQQGSPSDYSIVELNKNMHLVEESTAQASYEIGLIRQETSAVSPFALGGSYSDPLVTLEVKVEYSFGADIVAGFPTKCKINWATAEITYTNPLLITGTKTHMAYAGVVGINVNYVQFDRYSKIEPNWGWVPYSPRWQQLRNSKWNAGIF